MDKKFREKLALFLSLLIILLGNLVNKSLNNRNTTIVSKEVTTIEENNEKPNVIELHYYNDTVDVEESINNLGINSDKDMPYSCYKYMRFIDFYGNEKYAVVITYVDYDTDENKKITGTNYNCRNAFNDELLLTTKDIKGFSKFVSSEVYYVLEYGSLIELKNSLVEKGLDKNYADSIISDDVKDRSLSLYDVGKIYVLLVNSDDRLEKNYERTIK